MPQLDRADRLTAILERDGPTCMGCGRTFGPLIRPTTEHVVPRVKGGPSRLENEAATCGGCNGERGQRLHGVGNGYWPRCRPEGSGVIVAS